MKLQPVGKPFMEEDCVSVDLETTGLDNSRDGIIEIGAVKFRGPTVLGTFQKLVNPYRPIPDVVRRLTGISQEEVDRAPSFNAILGEFERFVGSLPVVGHNVQFDVGFLSREGLTISNETFDTWDLASAILPRFTDYSLGGLARHLELVHARPHRALDDAQVTHRVLIALLDKAREMDPGVLEYIRVLASRSGWTTGHLPSRTLTFRDDSRAWTGVDLATISSRLNVQGSLKPVGEKVTLNEEELSGYLADGGIFARHISGFEHRPQQVEMLRAIVQSFNHGSHIVVEGGTGVGKSMAYLLPSILFSFKNDARVVISTNTINLQEQLLQKDIPAVVKVLEEAGLMAPGEFRAAPLKGRDNYLCLRRWSHMAEAEVLSIDEARLLSKTLVWLQDTAIGDRAEVNLMGRDSHHWQRLSAGAKGVCTGNKNGQCFLRAARERAEAAHLVVVNHALLFSDVAMGGSVIPGYQYLIVDEAHHLEDEATRQLGFQVSQGQLVEVFDILSRLLNETRVLYRSSPSSPGQTTLREQEIADLEAKIPGIRDAWGRFFGVCEIFRREHSGGRDERAEVSLNSAIRALPAWADLEIACENVDVSLNVINRKVDGLRSNLSSFTAGGQLDTETITLELEAWCGIVEDIRLRLATIMSAPLGDRVDWIGQQADGTVVLHSAPLMVGPELQKKLFSRKECVALTSATLSSNGSLDFIRDRVGLAEADELIVGSPFDYRQSALLLVPEDMPNPNQWNYQKALGEVLAGLGISLVGHTMGLFTSHASLRAAANIIRPRLEIEGVRVLAQGIDGSPRQIMRAFMDGDNAVLLGTSSFWEGVDLPGGILKAVVVARLPFHVPTEPVFAARSELYEDPFNQYAVPRAALRFRQGVGRLIRGSSDRGAIVVLDQRVVSRPYGKTFLSSMPPCTEKRVPLKTIAREAARWVQR